MRRARFVLLVTLVACLTPGPAFAHIGWWDFLDELSGPGPFTPFGILGDTRLWCNSDMNAAQVRAMPKIIQLAQDKQLGLNVDGIMTSLNVLNPTIIQNTRMATIDFWI